MADENDGKDIKDIKVDVHLHVHFNVTVSDQMPTPSTPEFKSAVGNPLTSRPKLSPEEFAALIKAERDSIQASINRTKELGQKIKESADRVVENYIKTKADWAYPGAHLS